MQYLIDYFQGISVSNLNAPCHFLYDVKYSVTIVKQIFKYM